MVTSRTSTVRSRSTNRWFYNRVGSYLASAISSIRERHRSRAIGVEVGLCVLVVLTTSAVAWVSIWWVPAYLALMVVIFIVPEGARLQTRPAKSGKEAINGVVTQYGYELRVNCTDNGDHHQLAAEVLSSQGTDDSISALMSANPEFTSVSATKPRRGRSRTRKVNKAITGLAPGSPLVTWIRVGPGKFVRADGRLSATDQGQSDEITTGADPFTDAPSETAPMSSVSTDAQTAQYPTHPPEASPGDEGVIVASTDRMLESVAAEYGIAPSIFGPAPLTSQPWGSLANVKSEVTIADVANSHLVPDLGVNAPRHGMDQNQPGVQGGTSGRRVGRVARGIAYAISDTGRPYLRRKVPKGPKPRSLVWSADRFNARLRQVARRAFDRIPHVQRALRARSPPGR
jgi:hypothetical protein